jgi:hypothetical protein
MAKLIAPFELVGTIDDLNFYKANDRKYARLKENSGISKEQFRDKLFF